MRKGQNRSSHRDAGLHPPVKHFEILGVSPKWPISFYSPKYLEEVFSEV